MSKAKHVEILWESDGNSEPNIFRVTDTPFLGVELLYNSLFDSVIPEILAFWNNPTTFFPIYIPRYVHVSQTSETFKK